MEQEPKNTVVGEAALIGVWPFGTLSSEDPVEKGSD